MRIVKIVVKGEYPYKCVDCGYGYVGGGHGVCRALSFTGESPQKVDMEIYRSGRPLWCPLVKQKDGEE